MSSGGREYRCGCLLENPVSAIADRAARRILQYATPRAVTADDHGVVWVEPVDAADDFDLVAVYSRDLGILDLSRRLAGDLLQTKQEREFACKPKRRVVRREAA